MELKEMNPTALLQAVEDGTVTVEQVSDEQIVKIFDTLRTGMVEEFTDSEQLLKRAVTIKRTTFKKWE